MINRVSIVVIIATTTLVVGLALTKFFQISAAIAEGSKKGPPPVAVTSYEVQKFSWPSQISAPAMVSANRGAVLAFEASGQISSINFDSGDYVKEGDILVELESAVEKAELESAKSNLELANSSLRRQRALRKQNANSQSDLDSAEAELKSTKAAVNRLVGVLSRRKITAPFTGSTGIRLVNVGETVSIGQQVVSLNNTKSVFVDFSVPQEFRVLLDPGQMLIVNVDGEEFKGEVSAIESQIDPETRLLNIRGLAENPSEALIPGMFVNAKVVLDKIRELIAIPISSVAYAPYGNSVFSISPESTAVPKTVVLGEKRGDYVEVIKGLSAGDTIAGSGAFKIYPGAALSVKNNPKLQNQELPTPNNS